ncbi:APA family basic amino acid/polyamine antiporter [Kineosphaera limosa]|uniref:Putative amino acid transporter n=1 Tax=Kineosphaera limosa NBRC 100340 TaxID=1184609 RepID=K6WFZ4_9MICO|nr:amino acid permease [Kineosphaera limosa]NYE01396.1 APA family basic amino acid/polyamine antiporter [Kineosphaera limosa]GAB98205.1 putative amino acid transporter [Kineosphaera limosa NBRC 100340]
MTTASDSPLRKKSVETVLHQNDPVGGAAPTGLAKRLTAKDLVAFGIGMIIGTGIFTLTGVQAKDNAGPAVAISFLIAGVIALLAALCYAELAAAVPTAGSAYTYAYTTIGEIFAWIIAWDLVLEFALGAAVVARGWSGYLQSALGLPTQFFGEDSVVNLGAVFIALVLGFVALRGISESRWLTNVLVVIKVSVCLFIVLVGAFFVNAANWSPFVPPSEPAATEAVGTLQTPLWQVVSGVDPSVFGVSGVLAAAAVVFFAYSGFEVVANLGEETKNPGRDMPRGLIGSLVICTALYLAVCLVITGMVHYTQISEGAPLSDAFAQVGLGWAGVLIGIAAVCGLSSVILVDIVGMGRIGFALSRDGLLPPAVGRVHPQWRTPVGVTVGTTLFVAVLAAFVPLGALAEMVSIGTLFAFFVVSVAVIVLRRTNPEMKRPFRVPFSPWLPALSAVACLAMMASLATETWVRFVVWLLIGLAIYFGYGKRHSKLATGERKLALPVPPQT